MSGLVSLKDLIFHKPATRDVCIPSVLRFTYHSVVDVRTKAIRLASNLLYPEAAFRPTVEAFAKQVCVSLYLVSVPVLAWAISCAMIYRLLNEVCKHTGVVFYLVVTKQA